MTIDDAIISADVVGNFANLFITELDSGDCVDVYLNEKELQNLIAMLKTQESLLKMNKGEQLKEKELLKDY